MSEFAGDYADSPDDDGGSGYQSIGEKQRI
jgi:hypothetical protein